MSSLGRTYSSWYPHQSPNLPINHAELPIARIVIRVIDTWLHEIRRSEIFLLSAKYWDSSTYAYSDRHLFIKSSREPPDMGLHTLRVVPLQKPHIWPPLIPTPEPIRSQYLAMQLPCLPLPEEEEVNIEIPILQGRSV